MSALARVAIAITVASGMLVGVSSAASAGQPQRFPAGTVPPVSHAASVAAADAGGDAAPSRVSAASVSANTAPKGAPSPPADLYPKRANPDAHLHLKPLAPAKVAPPARAGVSSTPAAATLSTNFDGLDNSVYGSGPADLNAAAGLNDIVETVNESFAVYPKTGPVNGTPTYQSTLQKWFGIADTTPVFDPHVIFDSKTSRYAMVAEDGQNWLLSVSTSSTANPNTTLWCNYTMPARTNTNQFADFPQLGSDSRYFYLTMVDLAGGSQTDSVLAVVPKTQAESCKTVHWSMWSQLRDPGTACTLCTQDNLAFHVSPATVGDSLDGNGWLADAYSGGGSHITVWYLDSSNLLHAQQVSTPSYSVSTAAAQPGTTAVLDPDQPQFTGITKTGGELYLALSSGYDWGNGNKNAVVNWMQINATAGSIGLDKAGSFGAAGLWYLYPSSSGSALAGEYQTFTSAVTGSVPVGNSIASIDYTGTVTSNTYAPIGVSTYSGAPAGADEGCYVSNCYRWGDFTSMVIDPVDPGNTMWAAGMFAATDKSWATHITQITNS